METGTKISTHRPPTKCRPLNPLTNGFGAVRLISAGGLKPLPGPESGWPVSMFQLEGASTAKTGTLVSRSASMTLGKGSRTSPSKLKPEIRVSVLRVSLMTASFPKASELAYRKWRRRCGRWHRVRRRSHR